LQAFKIIMVLSGAQENLFLPVILFFAASRKKTWLME